MPTFMPSRGSLSECHTGRAGWGHGGSDPTASGPAMAGDPEPAPPRATRPRPPPWWRPSRWWPRSSRPVRRPATTETDAASLVAAFARGKRLCAAGETLVAARAAECHAYLSLGHRSPAEWLAAVTGASVGEAADVLKVGEALPSQPGVEEALRGGRLTPSRAKLVTGAVKVNPQKEAELVRGAEDDTFRQLRDRCLRARAEGRAGEDADAAHAAVHAARRCRTWTDEEGAFRLDALLTPEAGASLLASLTRQSDRFFHAARQGRRPRAGRGLCGRRPGGPGHRARPPARVPGRGWPPGGRATRGRGPAIPRAGDPKRRLAGAGGRGGGTVDAPRAPGHGPGPGGPGRPAPGVGGRRRDLRDPRGRAGAGRTARELLGDAWVDLVVSDGVDVTTICRMGRSLPPRLRTALVERDRCCVVPGLRRHQGPRDRPLAGRPRRRRAAVHGQPGPPVPLSPLPADPPGVRPLGGPGPVAVRATRAPQGPPDPGPPDPGASRGRGRPRPRPSRPRGPPTRRCSPSEE